MNIVFQKSGQPGHSYRCKILSDGVPISSGTLAKDLGGITIWTLWSNGDGFGTQTFV